MQSINRSHEPNPTIVYLDCPTGIAGDMLLGCLVDIGVPLEYLARQLQHLGIEEEYSLSAEKVDRHGQIATKVHVDTHSSHDHAHARHLGEIATIIQNAGLSPRVTQWSLQVFQQLAIAEGIVHGIAPEKVHFHEVGATDAIVDIVGACLGLDWLNTQALYCSPLPTGCGSVSTAHGLLTVPVPAVVKLWESRQVPVYSNDLLGELVTPTGAALAVTLAKDFGKMPTMEVERVGLGAGTKNLALPNILRLWLGKITVNNPDILETIAVLETQIDDLSPQAIAYTCDLLLSQGARDVFTQSITMKKSRLGVLLTVICPPEKIADCEQIIFKETTTLGIRRTLQERRILEREINYIETHYGTVRVKIARGGPTQPILNVQPEYEDCVTIAQTHDIPWREVHRLALEAWFDNKSA